MTSHRSDHARRPPRVSIGLPIYNGEAFLAETLDSLLAQTFDDFELIISDNASTDLTGSICRSYADRDTRIRYYRQGKNLGAVANYMRALELARGELFKWAASDDLCAPEYLARCVEVLDGDPSVVWCHTQTTAIDDQGHRITSAYDAPRARYGSRCAIHRARAHRRFRDVLLTDGWVSRYFGVMRVDAIRRCRPLMPYYGGERVQMAELILSGRYVEVPEPLFSYRHHPAASANLTSAAGQQWFCDPGRSSRFAFPRLHFLFGYIGAVWRGPIGTSDRAWCLAWILNYLLQVRKWKRILLTAWRGSGTGIAQLPDVANRTARAGTRHRNEIET